MESQPIVTINTTPAPTTLNPSLDNQPSLNQPGFTPMLMTTDSNGLQTLAPLPGVPLTPVPVMMTPTMPPMFGGFDSNVMPFGNPMVLTPSSSPLPVLSRSASPVPMLPAANQLPQYFSMPILPSFAHLDSGASNDSVDRLHIPSESNDRWTSSLSRERDLIEDVQPFESERAQEPLEPLKNEKNVPVPKFTKEMTKKELVNKTLDWCYEVIGSDHFDCEGRRGKNVLRIKVKTRGALEHICPFVNQCLEENLLRKLSCPISKKRQRRYVRGYLAYLECVSEEAVGRMIEIFNEINQVYVRNCDGNLEHPFKGISRNPIPVRSHVSAEKMETHHIAA